MELKKESTPKGAIKTNQVDYNAIQRNLQLPERIPPYKLSVMFKQAEKIINQLINAPHWQTSYDDIEFILQMILSAVRCAKVGGDKREY